MDRCHEEPIVHLTLQTFRPRVLYVPVGRTCVVGTEFPSGAVLICIHDIHEAAGGFGAEIVGQWQRQRRADDDLVGDGRVACPVLVAGDHAVAVTVSLQEGRVREFLPVQVPGYAEMVGETDDMVYDAVCVEITLVHSCRRFVPSQGGAEAVLPDEFQVFHKTGVVHADEDDLASARGAFPFLVGSRNPVSGQTVPDRVIDIGACLAGNRVSDMAYERVVTVYFDGVQAGKGRTVHAGVGVRPGEAHGKPALRIGYGGEVSGRDGNRGLGLAGEKQRAYVGITRYGVGQGCDLFAVHVDDGEETKAVIPASGPVQQVRSRFEGHALRIHGRGLSGFNPEIRVAFFEVEDMDPSGFVYPVDFPVIIGRDGYEIVVQGE